MDKPSLLDDFEALFQRHSGKFIVGGGGSFVSVLISAVIWFGGEYRETEQRARMTEAALDAHTAMERENYQAMMGVLDELQVTTGKMREDVAVIKDRLRVTPSRIADSDFAAPQNVVDAHDGMQ